jgi:hypothetical protein
MITPSFGLTATERVLPRLALDWTTGVAQTGVDVARVGVATFVGSNGLIQVAAENTQRIDYSTGVAGLLVEESRTNTFQYTEGFDDSYWVKLNTTVDPDVITAPDGNLTGDKLIADSTSGVHTVTRNISLGNNSVWTMSFYAKAAELSVIRLRAGTPSTWPGQADFNLTTGTVTTSNGTASIKDAGNGWYRCTLNATATASAASGGLGVYLLSSGNESFVGDGSSGVYIWGAQFESGAFPTSYIPRLDATAVTRNADVATMTGTNFSDWFNATEGNFLIEANPARSGTNGFMSANDNTNNNAITFYWSTTAQFQVRSGSATQATLSRSADSPIIICGAYKENDFAMSANAAAILTDTSGSIPTVSQLRIGATGSGINFLNGTINKLYFYPQRLVNAELVAFSK